MSSPLGSYTEWCTESGVRVFSKVALRDDLPFPYGRGVLAEEVIPSSKVVFSVPASLLLSVSTAEESLPEVFALREELSLTEDDLLAIHLMHEKHVVGDGSRWKPHIDLLPAGEDVHNAFYFTDDEKRLLAGSNIAHLAQVMQNQVRMDYARIFPTLFRKCEALGIRPRTFSMNEYRWAIAMIWSRFVSIPLGKASFKAMVPFFDMLNHSPTARTRHEFDATTSSFRLVTDVKIKAGEQVHLNYGPLGNQRLLQYKGFVIPGNPFDHVDVYLGMDPSADNYEAKQAVFTRCSQMPTVPFPLIADRLNDRFIATLRVQRATKAELEGADKAFEGRRLSAKNEQLVLGVAAASLVGMMAAYDRRPGDPVLVAELLADLKTADDALRGNAPPPRQHKGKHKGKKGNKSKHKPQAAAPPPAAAPTPAAAGAGGSGEDAAAKRAHYFRQCAAVLQRAELAILEAQVSLLEDAKDAADKYAARHPDPVEAVAVAGEGDEGAAAGAGEEEPEPEFAAVD